MGFLKKDKEKNVNSAIPL